MGTVRAGPPVCGWMSGPPWMLPPTAATTRGILTEWVGRTKSLVRVSLHMGYAPFVHNQKMGHRIRGVGPRRTVSISIVAQHLGRGQPGGVDEGIHREGIHGIHQVLQAPGVHFAVDRRIEVAERGPFCLHHSSIYSTHRPRSMHCARFLPMTSNPVANQMTYLPTHRLTNLEFCPDGAY